MSIKKGRRVEDVRAAILADTAPAQIVASPAGGLSGWRRSGPYSVTFDHHVRDFDTRAGLTARRGFGAEKLGAGTIPRPVGAYGMSKLMCERIGAHFAEVHGMSVICARIGWVQRTHDNLLGAHMAMGRWGQLMWLSDRDFLDAMTAAVTVPVRGFHIVNLVSDNPGMRWSLEEARAVLGWTPKDGAAARLPLRVRLRELRDWVRQTGMPRLVGRISGHG